jgi:hypothetical protein
LNINTLTQEEFGLLQDRDTPPKRLQLRDKMQDWLAMLRNQLWPACEPFLNYYPAGMDYERGKISRGEAYKQLPYQVLDYPRYFNAEDVMTLRCLVLWGYDFSLHFILRGNPHTWYGDAIAQHAGALQAENWQVGIGESPWVWEPNSAYYREASSFSTIDLRQQLQGHSFLKLTKRWPYQELYAVPEAVPDIWRSLQQKIWMP